LAILLPVLIYLLFHLLGWQYPALFWGADQLHYYPLPVAAVFVAVALALLLVSAKASWVARCDQLLAARIQHLGQKAASSRYPAVLGMLCFVVLGYLARDRYHYLGDSDMWFKVLAGSVRQHAPWYGNLLPDLSRVPEVVRTAFYYQPLDILVHFHGYRLGHYLFDWTVQASYEWLSLLAGAAYLAVLWKLLGLLALNPTQRLTGLALLATLGSIQLFLGYGESYTLVTLAAALYLHTALRALKGDSLLWPSLCLALAIALHALALSLLPSWCYLLWRKSGQPWKHHLHTPRTYLPLGLGAALVGLFLYTQFYPARLPLWTPDEPGRHALLSLPHLLQLFNALLLLSPFGLVWGLVWARRGGDDPSFHLLGWALLGSGALFCLHDAFLGGRDWDLLAFPALFYTLWGLRALHRAELPDRAWAQLRCAVLPLVALHTALWVGINAHSGRAIARLGNLLQYSNQTVHYQAYNRGHYYLDIQKNPEQAIACFREAVALAPPDTSEYVLRYTKSLGKALTTAGRGAEAVAFFEQAYARQPKSLLYRYDLDIHYYWALAVLQLGEAQYQQGDRLRAEATWRKGLERYLELGAQYERQGDLGTAAALWQEAIAHSQKILSILPAAAIYHQAGRGFQALGRYDEAIASYRQSIGLAQNPDDLYWTYIFLSRNLQVSQRRQEAIDALAAALNIRPNSGETHFALGNLYYADRQFDQAAASFRAAVALAPHNPQAHVNLGAALLAAGRTAEAEEAYREAARLRAELGLSPEISRGELKSQWNE
jgi:tetratricopeptide (TPR) repeat protein